MCPIQLNGIKNYVHLFLIDSAMFLLTGNSRSSLTSLRPEVQPSELLTNLSGGGNGGMNIGNGSSQSAFTKISDAPVKPGEINSQDSLKSLLDCCILYYYAVAHKYIIMVRTTIRNVFLTRKEKKTINRFYTIRLPIFEIALELCLKYFRRRKSRTMCYFGQWKQ